ncbi:MAG: hypothetical protein EBX52_14185, partial [Proteobacteria bacterium]|nr:hypothetical protein [Pseudomonadota bacterium]
MDSDHEVWSNPVMILTTGVLAFFQAFFLPGAAILRRFGLRGAPLVFLAGIPLSLLANYALILFCTLIGIDFKIPLFALAGISAYLIMRPARLQAILFNEEKEGFRISEVLTGAISILY